MRRLVFLALLIICTITTSGCIGRTLSKITQQITQKSPTIILRDTTQPAKPTARPLPSINFSLFKDGREHTESVGKIYDNLGMYVTDLTLGGGRSLEEKLTFLIADSLIRDTYDVTFDTNHEVPKADVVVSGRIIQFEIDEKSDAPLFDDRRSNLNRNIKLSTGSVDIKLTKCNTSNNKCEDRVVHVYKPKTHLTAQELATELMASIITEAKTFITTTQKVEDGRPLRITN